MCFPPRILRSLAEIMPELRWPELTSDLYTFSTNNRTTTIDNAMVTQRSSRMTIFSFGVGEDCLKGKKRRSVDNRSWTLCTTHHLIDCRRCLENVDGVGRRCDHISVELAMSRQCPKYVLCPGSAHQGPHPHLLTHLIHLPCTPFLVFMSLALLVLLLLLRLPLHVLAS